MMRLALRINPCAFQQILHLGYVVDYDVVMKETCRIVVDTEVVHTFHAKAFAALNEAGFSVAGNVKTLKQLCRKAIHSGLKFRRTSFPIPELNLPLPNSLVNYLCFKEVNF